MRHFSPSLNKLASLDLLKVSNVLLMLSIRLLITKTSLRSYSKILDESFLVLRFQIIKLQILLFIIYVLWVCATKITWLILLTDFGSTGNGFLSVLSTYSWSSQNALCHPLQHCPDILSKKLQNYFNLRVDFILCFGWKIWKNSRKGRF